MKHASPIHLSMLIVSAVALMVSIGMYWYLHHDTVVLTEHALVARNAALDEGVRQRQSKDTLALASSTADSRARISSFFVPSTDAVDFIQAMEAIGPASGATLTISSIGETAGDPKKEGIGTLTSQITLSGSWRNVMNAIELFEVLPYKVKIDHLNLTSSSVNSGDRAPAPTHTWQASFDISASTLI